jgi:hypothetical protein
MGLSVIHLDRVQLATTVSFIRLMSNNESVRSHINHKLVPFILQTVTFLTTAGAGKVTTNSCGNRPVVVQKVLVVLRESITKRLATASALKKRRGRLNGFLLLRVNVGTYPSKMLSGGKRGSLEVTIETFNPEMFSDATMM